MRRVFSGLLCLLLLCTWVMAAEVSVEADTSIRTQMQRFISEHHLDSSNFSVTYYNPESGESYYYNKDTLFPAGELWELPLHMYYYQLEEEGLLLPPEDDPMGEYTIGEMTLEECRYLSLIQGDRAITIKMRNEIGNYNRFKTELNERIGHCEPALLQDDFYTSNYFPGQFWMNCLKELAENGHTYGELMRNYQLVQPQRGFAAINRDYPMVHIFSEEEGFVCALGEITGPETFFLFCTVSESAGGEDTLIALTETVCRYVEESAGISYAEESNAASTDGGSDLSVVSKTDHSQAFRWILISLGAVLALGLIIGFVCWLIRRSREDFIYDD